MYEAIILLNDRNLFSFIKLTYQFMYYQQFFFPTECTLLLIALIKYVFIIM